MKVNITGQLFFLPRATYSDGLFRLCRNTGFSLTERMAVAAPDAHVAEAHAVSHLSVLDACQPRHAVAMIVVHENQQVMLVADFARAFLYFIEVRRDVFPQAQW